MRIRCTVLMLLAAFLMGISGGCAKSRTSPAEHSSELPSSVGESESNWKEVNADNSGLAYVQKQIHVPVSIAPSGLFHILMRLEKQLVLFAATMSRTRHKVMFFRKAIFCLNMISAAT